MLRFTKVAQLTLAAFLSCGLAAPVLAAPPTSPGAAGPSLKLSQFDSEDPDCSANTSGCDVYKVVSQTDPAWIHTVSLTAYLFAPSSAICVFEAGLRDDDPGNIVILAEVVATWESPAHYFIALPTPIMIDPGDEVFVKGYTNISSESCRGEGHFGFRIATDD